MRSCAPRIEFPNRAGAAASTADYGSAPGPKVVSGSLPRTNAFRLPGGYSASGCGRIWNRTISLVIPLPPSWCQFVTES